ncbi:MAG: hypothetical protein R6U41_06960 [Desulfosalsimonas sp.]|uniref:hypothetical protein n=1 Tax=Desulfosalsimonas sp. TaxID=3073848 RepID=UPI00397082ED
MQQALPEKIRLLEILKKSGFEVPDFIYLTAEDFENENFGALADFLKKSCQSYKVIVRSAHPLESRFKSGTFDSLEVNADIAGIRYARNRIIALAKTAKKLNIARQQKFNNAPEIDPEDMGVIVMPFIEGVKVMAKRMGKHWEFGYTNEFAHKIQCESYITETPHDMTLLRLSEQIQDNLGFACEIEYIVSKIRDIHVVQAKDISRVELLDQDIDNRSVQLDGIRRIRKRRNYRERMIYVMNNKAFYLDIINRCEDLVHGWGDSARTIDDIVQRIDDYEAELRDFALKHERFGVLGFSIKIPDDLFQIANHYLDDSPELQKQLSRALYENQYKIDYFLSEADTIIAKDRIRLNLCTHDAYGIDTVRNPVWFVYWKYEKQDQVVSELAGLGFKTGDIIGIDIDMDERPTIYRL